MTGVRSAGAALLLAGALPLLLVGCSTSSKSSDSSQGKTYTPDAKGKQAAGGSKQAQQSSAETTTGKPSAASDDGSSGATKGMVVMNPGAPAPAKQAPAGQNTH